MYMDENHIDDGINMERALIILHILKINPSKIINFILYLKDSQTILSKNGS
jgi:hypothetical protein